MEGLFVVAVEGPTPAWIKPGLPWLTQQTTRQRPAGIPIQDACALKAAASASLPIGTLHICRI